MRVSQSHFPVSQVQSSSALQSCANTQRSANTVLQLTPAAQRKPAQFKLSVCAGKSELAAQTKAKWQAQFAIQLNCAALRSQLSTQPSTASCKLSAAQRPNCKPGACQHPIATRSKAGTRTRQSPRHSLNQMRKHVSVLTTTNRTSVHSISWILLFIK